MSSEKHITALKDEHFPALASLFNSVFGKQVKPNFLRKKYQNGYLGKEMPAQVALDSQGGVIGFFGLLPARFQQQGQCLWAAQAMDIMVASEYRGQGFFKAMGQAAQAQAREIGYDFLFTFPNQKAEPAFLKGLDWEQLHQMRCFEMNNSLWKRMIKNNSGLDVSPWKEGELQFLTELSPGIGGGGRNLSFFEHKNAIHPSGIWEGEHGHAWLSSAGGILKIGDLAPRNMIQGNALVAELTHDFRQSGLKKVYFQCSPHEQMSSWFGPQWRSFDTWKVLGLALKSGLEMDRLFFTLADLDTF